LDLSLVASSDQIRRKEIFLLSQPGGHARHWNTISGECFLQLDGLLHDLYAVSYGDTNVPPTAQVQEYPVESLHRHQDVNSIKYPPPAILLKQHLQKKCEMMMLRLKNWRPVGVLLKGTSDMRIRSLFADCQRHIWAVEALSHLVVASVVEDTYGVVQNSLPHVISTMLDLQQAVEKICKTNNLANRRQMKDSYSQKNVDLDLYLMTSLRTALKLGIYRIVDRFQPYLGDIPLSAENMHLLIQYAQYKE